MIVPISAFCLLPILLSFDRIDSPQHIPKREPLEE